MATQPYTRIENALLNELCRLELNGREMRVLLFIIRYTKGFNRNKAKLSKTFISNGTNIDERSVRRILDSLAGKGLISISKTSKTSTKCIEFTGGKIAPSTGGESALNTGGKSAPQERKENKTPPSSASDERRRRLKEIMEAEWIPDEL